MARLVGGAGCGIGIESIVGCSIMEERDGLVAGLVLELGRV